MQKAKRKPHFKGGANAPTEPKANKPLNNIKIFKTARIRVTGNALPISHLPLLKITPKGVAPISHERPKGPIS